MNAGEDRRGQAAVGGPALVEEAAAARASFGGRLRRYRLAAGLTQEELAHRAGLSVRGIQDLERGARTTPQRQTVRLLVQGLGLAADAAADLAAVPRARRSRTRAEHRVRPAAEPPRLRQPLTRFVGRKREVAAIRRHLSQPEVRLLALTGPGGVGKTRLALQAASAVATRYPGGEWFVDLAAVRDPALVLPTIAHALGAKQVAGQPVLAVLQEHLRGQAVLLVLDNFEQVLDAGPAVTDLLTVCPQLTILVTSRAALRLTGEHEIPVLPMALPRDRASASDAARSEAVALFATRAQAVQPDFRLTDETTPIVADVCRRLDGLPLAIELAAARLRVFSLGTLHARLARRLPLLAGGPRDAPARQRTLRDTVAWSYALLSPQQQALFRRLAVFAGDFAPDAAAAVAAQDGLAVDLLDGLLALAEQNLLQPAIRSAGEPRFALLETVREFALEQLDETPEAGAVRKRHAAYCLALAERAAGARNTAQDARALGELEAEHANLRAALEWALQHGAAEGALRLAGALGPFWGNTGRFAEGRAWLARALDLSPRPTTRLGRAALARAVSAAGGLAYNQGDYAAALPLLDEALVRVRALGDIPGILGPLQMRALLARRLGDLATAEALLNESVDLARRAGTSVAAGHGLARLGVLAHERGDSSTARRYAEEGLAIGRTAGATRLSAFALLVLGNVALQQRDLASARSHLAESLALYRELGDPIYFGEHLEAWGHVAVLEAQPLRALRLAAAAAALRASAGIAPTPFGQRTVEKWVGEARQTVGPRPAQAAWEAGQAMPLDAAIDYVLADVGGATE